MLLDTIHSRQDLLDIPEDQLGTLCGEIRQFLVQNVSRTGGHLPFPASLTPAATGSCSMSGTSAMCIKC